MQTSPKGVKALEIEEAVVLRAYKDIAGVWTIGAGLTAASGVVTPRAGMEITAEEARELLAQALKLNYEPAVRAALTKPAQQHEFDAAVSFHWNTGEIYSASWVKSYNAKVINWTTLEAQFKSWNKAKTKKGRIVVSGLVKRREREFEMLRHGIYPVMPMATPQGQASFTHAPTAKQIAAINAALNKLGFNVAADADRVPRDAIRAFQDQYNLRVDGIVGPATLNTLQRAMDEREPAFVRFLRSFL